MVALSQNSRLVAGEKKQGENIMKQCFPPRKRHCYVPLEQSTKPCHGLLQLRWWYSCEAGHNMAMDGCCGEWRHAPAGLGHWGTFKSRWVHRNKRPGFQHRACNTSRCSYIRPFLVIPLLVSSDAKVSFLHLRFSQRVLNKWWSLGWPHTPVTSTLASSFGPSLHSKPMRSVIINWPIILAQTLFEDVRSGTERLWRCSRGPPIVCGCCQRSVA